MLQEVMLSEVNISGVTLARHYRSALNAREEATFLSIFLQQVPSHISSVSITLCEGFALGDAHHTILETLTELETELAGFCF